MWLVGDPIQLGSEQSERHVWLIYSRQPGKISAAPANAKGWVALAGCIVIIVPVGRVTSCCALQLHPVFGFFMLMAVIIFGVLLTIRLAIAKGKQGD